MTSRRTGWRRAQPPVRLAVVAAWVLVTQAAPLPVADAAGTTTRVSVSADDVGGDAASGDAEVSGDGRSVAFVSLATNLVAGDTNATCDHDGDGVGSDNCADVFVRDRDAGTTTRVSLSSAPTNAQGDGASLFPSISGDGSVVAFTSFATNLVVADGNASCDNDGDEQASENCPDVFVRDRTSNLTSRASVSTSGAEGNGWSAFPSLSGDGSIVAFASQASNLVPSDSNSATDVFVRVRTGAPATERVSLASDGTQANGPSTFPATSADGRFVAFESDASNLVAGDTNAETDVFVRDRQSGTTVRVSVASDGSQGDGFAIFPAISSDGRFVSFTSSSTALGGEPAGDCDLDGDGVGDAPVHVYVHDLATGRTELASASGLLRPGRGCSVESSLSADGRFVSFSSDAPDLVAGDTNGVTDTFLRDRRTGCTVRSSEGTGGIQGNADSSGPDVDGSGRVSSFSSDASNLVAGDGNAASDVFADVLAEPSTPASVTFLPEGATHSGFTTFVLLANPTDEPATVDLTFLTPRGPACAGGARGVAVPAGQRVTLNVNALLAPLGGVDVATEVVARGAPVVAEVSLQKAGSLAAVAMAGAEAPSASWIVPEGATHSGFTTFVTIANPSADPTTVDVDFLTRQGGAVTGPQGLSVPARGRATVNVNTACACADDVSTRVAVADGPDVVVAMSMHRRSGDDLGVGGSPALTGPDATWVVAEGVTHSDFATFVLVANPNDATATVDVTFLTKASGPVAPSGLQALDVPAGGRVTIPVDRYVPADDVATLVEATSGTVAVGSSVQKATSAGFVIADSTGASGATVQDATHPRWIAAEGATHSGFATFVLIANPDLESPATVNVSFLTRAEGKRPGPQGLQVPAGGRVTVVVRNFVLSDDVSTLVEAASGEVVVEMAIDRIAADGFSKGRSLAAPLP